MRHVVTADDTAEALGSGDVPVLATPRLLAWLEAATVRAARAHVGDGQTSVGTAVDLRHRRATPVGAWVEVQADPPAVEGRRLAFPVRALDADGEVVAEGTITRAVVDRASFG